METKRKVEAWVVGIVLIILILLSMFLSPFLAVAGAHRAYRLGLERGREGMRAVAEGQGREEYLRGFRDGQGAMADWIRDRLQILEVNYPPPEGRGHVRSRDANSKVTG